MSAAPVFSAASIAGCIFTVLVSIALPVAALAVLKRKTGRGLLAALVGAGCFIGYALVLEQLLHAAVFSLFPAITLYPAAYTAYGCLAAGLFEETGRLMGLSLLCKKDRDLALGVGYGIGHGKSSVKWSRFLKEAELNVSFEEWCLRFGHADLLAQWDEVRNEPLKPSDVSRCDSARVWWRGECGHSWQLSVRTR